MHGAINDSWAQAVVVESQRFVCRTVMTGSLDEGPRQARALRAAIAPPPDRFAAKFLRGELFELAMRWGGQRHRRLAHKCKTHPCAVASLIDGDRFWPTDFESAETLALDLFVAHVTAIRDELAATHGVSIADRAAALFAESGGTTTVEHVARTLGAHPSTLRRAFQRQFGQTAREYLRRVRLERAEALLVEEKGGKVEPVAYAVGWSSKGALYRAFRRYRNETPGQSRNLS